jgi:predicted RNase H-like nuclease
MRFVGVDLAWGQRNRTGLATVDATGTLVDLADARTDGEILRWLEPHVTGSCLVAFDAPIVVRNPTGRRHCEAELGRVFGRYQAGAHPSNTSMRHFAEGPRALRLSEALGLDIDPASTAARRAIEVYPHPATVALFGLDRTIKYKHKPGRTFELLRSESIRLVGLVESLGTADPPLRVSAHPGWRGLRETVEHARRKADLRSVEDVVDAVICAYVALFAERKPALTRTFGDAVDGYIVTPALM